MSCSYAYAARKSVASSNGRPRIWRPIGSPSRVKPQGIAIAGIPARLAGATYERRVKNRPATSWRVVIAARPVVIGGAAWCAFGHKRTS